MDKLLQQHPLCNYRTYKEFIEELYKDGFSQGLTFETINYELYALNKEIYQEFTRKLVDSYVYTPRQKLTR